MAPRIALAALALVFVPRPALSQANYDGALIGGRSSLMGGTGVAAGADAAAPLQNPATTVDIQGTSFVFSTFFLELSQRSVAVDQELLDEIRRGGADLSQTSVNVLPNSTCLFLDLHRDEKKKVGAHKLSVCFAEPESSAFELGSRVLAEGFSGQLGYQHRYVTQAYKKKVYAVGWAHALSDVVSVGVTPMLEDVTFKDQEVVATLIDTSTSGGSMVGSEGKNLTSVFSKRASAFAATALLGVQFTPTKIFSAGLSLRLPSVHLFGDYSAATSAEGATGGGESYIQESGSASFNYPLRLALGIAGQLGRVRYEVNGYFHTGRGDFAAITSTRSTVDLVNGTFTKQSQEEVSFNETVHPTANVGLGVEVPLWKEWALVSGVLTDFSALTPRHNGDSAQDTLFRQRMNSVHASIGAAWLPTFGSVLFGIRGRYGEGELGVADPRTLPITRFAAAQSEWGLSLVVSGQISLEMLSAVDPTGLIKSSDDKLGTSADP